MAPTIGASCSISVVAKQITVAIPPSMVAPFGKQQVLHKIPLLWVLHLIPMFPYKGTCSLPRISDTTQAPCCRRTKAAKVEPAIELLASLYNQSKLAA